VLPFGLPVIGHGGMALACIADTRHKPVA